MSIKSDKWIKEMANNHRMIEPFEAGQVRLGAKEEKLISYGTSSYGYDVRCSNEFKVFTNINSAVVDPKKFDANSFAVFPTPVPASKIVFLLDKKFLKFFIVFQPNLSRNHFCWNEVQDLS